MERNLLVLVLVMALSMTTYAATVAQWDFEDGGPTGIPFTEAGQPNGSGGSADLVNGTMMYGWNWQYGPSWSDATPDGSNFCSQNLSQDGYTTDATINSWSPSVWTIEISCLNKNVGGWKTMLGRDGSSQGEPESDFYLSSNGIDNRLRINIDTVGGQRWILDADTFVPQEDRWYGYAITSDGVTLSMYVDDSSGYQLVGSMDISAQSVADNALGQNGSNWTFGRGWYNGSFVDHITGLIDNVRFSDTVLDTADMIGISIPEPATLTLLGLGALAMLRKRK